MEKIQLINAERKFKKQYEGRYQIVNTLILGNQIVCCVENFSSIACIPVFYCGYKIRVMEEDKMRDFL